jgi:hypothetical protein
MANSIRPMFDIGRTANGVAYGPTLYLRANRGCRPALGDHRAIFWVLRHLATGDQHRHYDCHVSDGASMVRVRSAAGLIPLPGRIHRLPAGAGRVG